MRFRMLVAAAAVALTAGVARAQDAVPCKALACVLTLDWGGSKTAADYPPDKRYGSGDDFEQKIKAVLTARGFRFTDKPNEGAMTMYLRPTMKSRVMCDQMAGINPEMACTAMTALAVNFTSPDKTMKAPGAMRISNRCAAGDIYMLNTVFAQYSADMIWYQLEGQAQKADKPISNC
jgi:hypothetical protein